MEFKIIFFSEFNACESKWRKWGMMQTEVKQSKLSQ